MVWGFLSDNFYALAILISLWFSWKVLKKNNSGNVPPGPLGIPFFGYLPFLGKERHKTFSRLAKKYGGIFGLYLGNQYFVVLDDIEVIREANSKEALNAKPHEYFEINAQYPNLIQIAGHKWKLQRRFQLSNFNTLGFGKDFMEFSIMSEIKTLIEKLKEKVADRSVNIGEILEHPFNNIMFYLLYGEKFNSSHPYVKSIPEFHHALGTKFRWQEEACYFPWLRILRPFRPSYWKVEKTIKNMVDIISAEVKSHEDSFDATNLRDFIDHFLAQIQTRQDNPEDGFDRESLIGNMLMLLAAGSVTTQVTFTWFLINMAENPVVQDKVCKEILDHLGSDKDPEFGDRLQLPYTCAVIAESQRVRPIMYLGLHKKCDSDGVKVNGFDIPKDTVIVHNIWSQNNNEVQWPEPEKFKPERFLYQGEFKAPEYFLPFSCGKRACPGAKNAEMKIFLFAVCLLRRFRFLEPEGGVSKETLTVFNVIPAKPFLRVELRQELV